MSRGRGRGARPGWARVGMLAVLLVVCPWAARGQYVPPQDDAGWRQAAEEGRRASEDRQRGEQARQDALSQQVETARAFNETNGPMAQVAKFVLVSAWWLALGAAGLVALALGTRAVLRLTAPTDPEKLALSDPWVRAHLDQLNAAQGDPKAPDGQETT